jgi:acid phosphatase type 7
VGAGDIAARGSADIATGDLIDARPDALVFTAGDNAYPKGSASDFTTKYEEEWGLFKARTMPSPGNHEYETPGASGYFDYFSAPPAAPVPNTLTNPGLTKGKGYYSYDLGSWHILSLNSNISMAMGDPQYNFVQNDLTTNRALCELAYWHHPIASSGQHGNEAVARPIFELFDTQGGDLVLNGHDHNYEAFKKINYLGEESESGVRQIVVGTGGTGLRGQGFLQPGSEERNFNTHGIVDITLDSTGYSGTFVPVPGKSFTDSFSGTCGTN